MKQLIKLIKDYLKDVEVFNNLLKEKIGNETPLRAPRIGLIPKEGSLFNDGKEYEYYFHGRGCQFTIEGRVVDFDFGENFRFDGFDFWRLLKYSKSRLDDYQNLADESNLKKEFDNLIKSDIIRQGNASNLDTLYYLSDSHAGVRL